MDEKDNIGKEDIINRPSHYKATNGIECIDVIEGFGLNYRLGNTIKYICRANNKGKQLQDLKKAEYYLKREISKIATHKKAVLVKKTIPQIIKNIQEDNDSLAKNSLVLQNNKMFDEAETLRDCVNTIDNLLTNMKEDYYK